MKTRHLPKEKFDRLVARFKVNVRYGMERSRMPYETDEEYTERLKQYDKPPTNFTYHGKFHTVQFSPK